MVPHRIVHAEPHEPPEQKVELHPLHQMALRAHPIKGLQQHRPQQLLRRDRRPAEVRIKRRKVTRQVRQRRVCHGADRPQRMILPDPCFQINVAEKRSRPLVPAAHPSPRRKSASRESRPAAVRYRLLQQPVRAKADRNRHSRWPSPEVCSFPLPETELLHDEITGERLHIVGVVHRQATRSLGKPVGCRAACSQLASARASITRTFASRTLPRDQFGFPAEGGGGRFNARFGSP